MTDIASPARRGWSSLIGPGIAALVAFAILISLGVWQIHRLAWKEALLARIHARIHAPPKALPPASDWPKIDPQSAEYSHVSVTGTFENDKEAYIFGGTRLTREGNERPGYLVVTPMRLADGSEILVNRGFVPENRKNPATRPQGQLTGTVTITGLLRAPESRNLFTPADEPAKDLWFTRDPVAVAHHLGLSDAPPFSIDADASMTPAGGYPAGGATVLEIPNNHLSYAVTWFGLAGTLVGVFGAFAWRRLKGRD